MKQKSSTSLQSVQKIIATLAILGSLTACQTRPIVYVPAPALREVFRGGEIKGLENNDRQWTGEVGDFDRVEHVCSSSPVYDLDGNYVRTSVRCW